MDSFLSRNTLENTIVFPPPFFCFFFLREFESDLYDEASSSIPSLILTSHSAIEIKWQIKSHQHIL